MIKLIATDVDGTLVKDGTLLIDPEYMTVVSRLVDQGIHFRSEERRVGKECRL